MGRLTRSCMLTHDILFHISHVMERLALPLGLHLGVHRPFGAEAAQAALASIRIELGVGANVRDLRVRYTGSNRPLPPRRVPGPSKAVGFGEAETVSGEAKRLQRELRGGFARRRNRLRSTTNHTFPIVWVGRFRSR